MNHHGGRPKTRSCEISTENMYHRTEAIRLVKERVRDPIKALSDGTIKALANMAVYKVETPSQLYFAIV